MSQELIDIEFILREILDDHRMSKDAMRGRVLDAWGRLRRLGSK